MSKNIKNVKNLRAYIVNMLEDGYGNPRTLCDKWMRLAEEYENVENEKLGREIENVVSNILEEIIVDFGKFDRVVIDHLFLFIMSMNTVSDDIVDNIKKIAKTNLFYMEDKVDLHSRVLQTLVFLQIQMPVDFWTDQINKDSQKFGMYAFAGIRKFYGLEKALNVLNYIDFSDPSLVRKLIVEISGLLSLEEYDFNEGDIKELWNDICEKYDINKKV